MDFYGAFRSRWVGFFVVIPGMWGGFDPVPLSPTQRSLDRPLESKADGAISRKSDDIGDVDLKAFPIRDISTHFEN